MRDHVIMFYGSPGSQLIRSCYYPACVLMCLTSSQGVGILFFHVIRSEKVWSKIGPQLTAIRERTLRSRKYEVVSYLSTCLFAKCLFEYNPRSDSG